MFSSFDRSDRTVRSVPLVLEIRLFRIPPVSPSHVDRIRAEGRRGPDGLPWFDIYTSRPPSSVQRILDTASISCPPFGRTACALLGPKETPIRPISIDRWRISVCMDKSHPFPLILEKESMTESDYWHMYTVVYT